MVALIITLVLKVLCLGLSNVNVEPIMIQPIVIDDEPVVIDEETDWILYRGEAYQEYLSMFDDVFNAVEYKRSKNGRSMTKSVYSNSFKFAPKGI